MSLKFRKSIQIFPGVRLNLSKSGLSVSFGPRGLKYSVNSKGKTTATIGIPGTGLSYSKTLTKAIRHKKNLPAKRDHAIDNESKVIEFQNYLSYITGLHLYADTAVEWLASGPSRLPEISADESAASHYVQMNTQPEALASLASQVIQGNLDAYEQVLRAYLPLQDLAEFGSGFDIELLNAHLAVVVFELNKDEVIPKEKLSLTPTGKLSQKAMPQHEYDSIAADYLASAVIRIALDLFALLPLTEVHIIAKDLLLSPVTGHSEAIVRLDLIIDKKTLDSINLETIDPSSALQNFTVLQSTL